MERKNELQDLIDAHLLGDATPEQEQALQTALAGDATLQQDIDATEDALAAIHVFADQEAKSRLQKLEERLKTEPLRVVERNNNQSGKRKSLSSKSWLAVAAALALIVTAGWFIFRSPGSQSGTDLFATNFTPYNNIAVTLTRGADNPTPEEIAYTAYENKDWAKATDLLAALPASPVNSFYLAQAALATGDHTKAEALLRPLANSNFPLRAQAYWYLALTELAQGNKEEARSILEQQVPNWADDMPFKERGEKLLKELNKS